MKSKYFRDRNLRLFAKHNEIKTKIVRSLFEEIPLSKKLRHKVFLQLTNKKKWGSFNRVRRRCLVTQRNRGVIRLTKTSRLVFRKLATQGYLPGVHLSTW